MVRPRRANVRSVKDRRIGPIERRQGKEGHFIERRTGKKRRETDRRD